MRKLLFFTCLMISGFLFSQTTEQEYNYLTNGYAKDVENGKDIKEGYNLKKFYDYTSSSNTFIYTYYLFNENKTNKTKAILIVLEKPRKNKTRYLCLPIDNKYLFNKFFKDVEKIGIAMGMGFDVSALNLLQVLIDNYANKTDLNN